MTTTYAALCALCPTAKFTLNGEDYQQLIWHSDDITKPTLAEVNTKIAELKIAEPMRLLRMERNRLLIRSDWTQGSDVPDAIKTSWATYRQKLRDLPANTSDPNNPSWPVEPS